MTTTIETRVAQVKSPRGRKPAASMAASAAAMILQAATTKAAPTWPDPQWQTKPVAFARDVLAVEPWAKQAAVLEALVPHAARVSVKSGHKCGKSTLAVLVALWFYCSFPEARVVMSSVTDRQVNQILWRELRRILARAGRCEDCRTRDRFGLSRCERCEHSRPITGEMHDLARSGYKSPDFREITGFTAKEAEAVAGISGANLLYILDEASGIPDVIYEAIEGNRAGGARLLMIGNPTRCEGEFYRSHTDKKNHYRTFTISSEETPNAVEGRMVIPGLAGREWIQEKREEWGEDSALYQVRIRGEYARQEDQKVIPLYLVEDAHERWAETPAEGRLQLGVDVARFGDDDSVIAVRRGSKITEIIEKHGLSEIELANEVVQVARRLRKGPELRPLVKVDSCGGIGLKVAVLLQGYANEIEVVPVNVAERSTLQREFPRVRDQLWFGLRAWLAEGGALPENTKLDGELTAPKFYYDDRQRRAVETKDNTRKLLKRSPDRADAVALAVWEPAAYRAYEPDEDMPAHRAPVGLDPYHGVGMDPYAGVIDPYGGA